MNKQTKSEAVKCVKCNGTGAYGERGICYACKGTGGQTIRDTMRCAAYWRHNGSFEASGESSSRAVRSTEVPKSEVAPRAASELFTMSQLAKKLSLSYKVTARVRREAEELVLEVCRKGKWTTPPKTWLAKAQALV